MARSALGFAILVLLGFADAHAQQPVRPAPPVSDDPFFILFDWNSAEITPETAAILDNVVAAYRARGAAAIAVTGHADSSGPAASNLRLSRRRAGAVAVWLARHGIPRAAIVRGAFGEARLPRETPDNVREIQNRRVDIAFPPPVLR